MRQATRLMRPLAAVGILAASFATSVSISASDADSKAVSSESTGTSNVEVNAVAKQLARRTGVTATTKETTPPTTAPPAAPSSSSQAARVLDLVNQERTARGLQPLVLEARLNAASQAHSVHQAALGTIFHIAPDGTGPGQRIAATGYSFSTWAENVAAGQSTAGAVVQAWMTSPGHCRNILNPAYTEMGVGYLETATSYRHWWTQKFARPSGTPTPPGTYNPAWC